MSNYNQKTINILSLIVGLIAILFTAYVQFIDPQTGIILFLGVLIFITIYFIVSYIVGKFNKIEENKVIISNVKKDLNNLKDKLNIIKESAKLDARLSFLENKILKMKNKKGQIDPRIIILIIIIILLFLYLRSKGIF